MRRPHDTDRGALGATVAVALIAVVTVLALTTLTAAVGTPALSGDRSSATGVQDDGLEPNDEFDTAADITTPFGADALEIGADDADFYSVSLDRGDRLDVSIAFDHDDADVDLVVYNPRRNVVASGITTTDDESASVQANEDGPFYILVLAPFGDTATYSLTVDTTPGDVPANDDAEPNDRLDTATDIQPPVLREDLRIVTYDRDVYAVDLAAESTLSVSATFDHNQTDIDLRLYDQRGTLLDGSGSVTDGESLSTVVDDTGTYYIEVYSADDSSGSYSLSVQAESSGTPTDPVAALAGTDGRFQIPEVLRAIELFNTGETVPGTDGATLGIPDVLRIIELFNTGETV